MAIYEIIIRFDKSEYLIHTFQNESEIKRERFDVLLVMTTLTNDELKARENMYAIRLKGNGFLVLSAL